jgi:hypothetical protein
MDNLTDIEAIILSQRWKKSKTTINSPMPFSPLHRVEQKKSLFSPLCFTYESLTTPEVTRINSCSPDQLNRVQQLAKLAVPYKTLTDAINRKVARKSDPTLIPAFPMRKFGFSKKIEPVFEKLTSPDCQVSKEIFFIKQKSGRTISNKNRKITITFSPRFSKERVRC